MWSRASTSTSQGPGTGDGFASFCAGEADISDASRADRGGRGRRMRGRRRRVHRAQDRLRRPVGHGQPGEHHRVPELRRPLRPGRPGVQGFDNWQDAQPLATELGSTTQFPDLPLDITAPGEESGTYDSFIELALGDIIEAQGHRGGHPARLLGPGRRQHDHRRASRAPTAASAGSASPSPRAPATPSRRCRSRPSPAANASTPAAETIADGSYPLSRPLFIYVSNARPRTTRRCRLRRLLPRRRLSAVEEVGYVALPDDELEASRTTWDDRTTGAQSQ